MNNQLKNIMDQYKNGQLKVRNESFSTETILDGFLALSSFTNVNFLDLNLTQVFLMTALSKKLKEGVYQKLGLNHVILLKQILMVLISDH